MPPRTTATGLTRLLNSAAGPVYVLDDQQRLVFLNRACAEWVACEADDLLGLECRYHSSPEAAGPAAIAAALAPPCEVWSGERATALVSIDTGDGATAPRRVDFLPLGSDAVDATGVIALVAATPIETGAAESAAAEETFDEESAADLHQRLRHWRRKLAGRYHLDRLLGESPAMRQVRNQVELAATSAASVSIVGPPGSGRQHVAHAIHYGRLPLAAGELAPLACPLLDETLLESTIRGLAQANAAALQSASSQAAAASRPPTLLLADVDQLDLDVQKHFLRTLASMRGVLRLISTSREPLAVLAARGEFRPDLACALATVEIRLPRLAERIEDAPLLAQRFVEERNRQGAKQIAGLSPEALDRVAAYPWPGNVAELAEAIQSAHAQAEGTRITPSDLPARIQLLADATARPRRQEETIVLEEFMARIEEELIRRALSRAKGNKAKAARLLGMTRPRLYRRLAQLGLEAGPPEEEA
ncbi:MAG TPA: sigma 54-interacting transcriptional regulator [Pirellulales bacterium]|jgi:DNA-binding NtrC family response regulator